MSTLAPTGAPDPAAAWPPLPYDAWRDTYATLHMWTQIVGKIRLALSPTVNHWWQVPLYVTPRGLTTSPIPSGARTFALAFDFVDHQLRLAVSDGRTRALGLYPRSVADFYQALFATLRSVDIAVTINPQPQEVPDPIPFDQDTTHAAYDPVAVERFRQVLVQTDRVFQAFRGGFLGKCSPVHFFWGSFDLVVTRFSGRRAPARPGADYVTREAYSHECISAGFWPGSGSLLVPAYYAYAAPEPPGLGQAPVQPAAAYYDPQMQEFLLPYDAVRTAPDPRAALLAFLQSTYAAGADLGGWDRAALERPSAAA